MNSIKKLFMWWLMLTKRLLKKATFIVLLIAVPISSFAFSLAAKEDSGFVTVALCEKDPDDPISNEIVKELTESTSLIRYITCKTESEAKSKVSAGKADCAWIFPDSMESHIENFIQSQSSSDSFITVYVRENTVLMQLACEKLTGSMFEILAQEHYISFLRKNAPELKELTDEQLLSYYHKVTTPESLFIFDYADSEGHADISENDSYLLSPLKGILGVVILLSGLATSMYFIKDKSSGLFDFANTKMLPYIELGYQLVSNLLMGISVLLSLLLMGLMKNPLIEISSLLLCCISISVFCILLRALVGNLKAMAVMTPLAVIINLALTPIFFALKNLLPLQLMLPVTYFIKSLHSPIYLLYNLIYIILLWFIYRLVCKLKRA